MYDPGVGRWLEEDPVGFDAGDPNLYRYVQNAPTAASDPSGQSPLDFFFSPSIILSSSVVTKGFGALAFSASFINFTSNPQLKDVMAALGGVREAVERLDSDLQVARSFPSADWSLLPPHMQVRLRRWFAGNATSLSGQELWHVLYVVGQVRSAFNNGPVHFQFAGGATTFEARAWPAFGYPTEIAPSFFNLRPRRQAGVLFHELTHRYGWTADYGYFQNAALTRTTTKFVNLGVIDDPRPIAPNFTGGFRNTYTQLVQGDAYWLVRNADSYEGFLEDYYLDFLPN